MGYKTPFKNEGLLSMKNSIHSAASRQSISEISPGKRKRAPNRATTLNGVQPLDSHKKIKTQPSTLDAASLREPRAFTSEPYAAGIRSVLSGDILMGRGSVIPFHSGNSQLRYLITHGSATVAPVNIQTHTTLVKSEKKQICLNILKELHGSIPRRRFLKQDQKNDLHFEYYEVPDMRAIEKIAQTIRDIRIQDLRRKPPTNEVTSTKNNIASIPQYSSLKNQQDDEPIPYNALYSHIHDPLDGLYTHPDLVLDLNQFSEDDNERKLQATAAIDQTTADLEPIPLNSADSEEHYIKAIYDNPSRHLLFDLP